MKREQEIALRHPLVVHLTASRMARDICDRNPDGALGFQEWEKLFQKAVDHLSGRKDWSEIFSPSFPVKE